MSNAFPLAEIINRIIREIPIEDPLKYLDNMYASVNPAFISYAVQDGKDKLQRLNNRNGKNECSVYFTLGSANHNRDLITGFFGALLWLEEYIVTKAETNHVSKAEVETFRKIMRCMALPQISDTTNPSGRNFYVANWAACMSHFSMWLSRASMANAPGATHTRNNLEVCKMLTSSAFGSYPAIPFTAYYLGTIKTNDDLFTVSEKMRGDTSFMKYITEDFSRINEPKFVAMTPNAPIVDTVGHPLCMMTYGVKDGSNIEWLAGFTTSKEFENVCAQNDIDDKAVKKYILSTSLEHHKENLKKEHKIAKFINDQKIIENAYKLLHERSGLFEDVEHNYIP